MSRTIDWMYNRTSCVTCKKARAYLEKSGVSVRSIAEATKIKYPPAEAIKLVKGIATIIAMRGAKSVRIGLGTDRPDDSILLAHLMGPTGNLRAPTLILKNVMLVGFNEAIYDEIIKGEWE